MLPTDIGHFYEVLREANPWLPPADYVAATPGFSMELGLNKIPTLRLEVFIVIPDVIVGSGLHHFYTEEEAEEHDHEVVPEEHQEPKPEEFSADEQW